MLLILVKDLSDDEVDSDEDLEEDESDGSNTEALIEHIEGKFRTILDEKIIESESFFDHHEFAVSTVPLDVTEIPKEPFRT
jgi:hypothetical protein